MKDHETNGNHGTPSVILFGIDDHDKPRAGVFKGKLADPARKAADHLQLRTIDGTTAESQAIMTKLPAGRIQADGQPFLPFVRRDLYDQLVAIACSRETPLAAIAASQPPNADAMPPTPKPAPGLPRKWDDIATGHVIIAQDDYADEGWWEAVVLDRKNDVLTLRWRDYPKYKPFTRHLAAIALLNPTPK